MSHRARIWRPLGVLVAVTSSILLLNGLASRYGTWWDVTRSQRNTLSSQAQSLLNRLDRPLRLVVVASRQEQSRYGAAARIFAAASPLVPLTYVDADREPALTRQYQGAGNGRVLVDYDGRVETAVDESEYELARAIARVIDRGERIVYFTTGHGERDPASSERTGYGNVATALHREGFTTRRLSFLETSQVPDDARIVVVAGPKVDFFEPEVEALRRFLARGGAVLFLMDPLEDVKRYITESGTSLFMVDNSMPAPTPDQEKLTALLAEWDIALGPDVVIDMSGRGEFMGTDASVAIAASYDPHPITSNLTSLTAFPMARSVTGTGAAQPLVTSARQSWGETDIARFSSSGDVSLDPATGDRPGPLTLAVAVARADTRLVAIGDSDFAANYTAGMAGNTELFVKSLIWLARAQPLEPPAKTVSGVGLQARWTRGQRTAVDWSVRFALPALIWFVGVYIWLHRRHA